VLAEKSLHLLSGAEQFAELIDTVEEFGASCCCDRKSWLEFVTAISEIGGNILVHAYSESAPGSVDVTLRCYADCVEAQFRDHGAPFVGVPAQLELANEQSVASDDDLFAIAENGRGLALARMTLTVLEYERASSGENRWRLAKRFGQ
jgi:anti-sigma regulatory factor (Ser/Thr protein kinase)